MDKRTRALVKSKIIEDTVRNHFKQYARETWEGEVCTNEVLNVVETTLHGTLRYRMNKAAKGEAFDCIRDLGPEGEEDLKWGREWGIV